MAIRRHRPRRRVMLATVWLEQAHLWGIARYAHEADWVLDSVGPQELHRLVAWQGDGVICQLHPSARRFVELVRRLDVPKVEMADYVADMNVPRVMPDYDACGRRAAEHFLSRGFQHFAVAHPWEVYISPRGFVEPITRAGHSVATLAWAERSVRRAGYGPMDRRQWLADRLLSLPKPLAVLAPDYTLAAELLDSCSDAGLLVPDHVAVVAFSDDGLMCELAPVPLSSIAPNYEQQAHEAARLLDRLMRGEAPPSDRVLIPPRPLVIRRSSDGLAVRHPGVARALRFLRESLHRKALWVPEVARAAAMSRRGLDRAFRQHLGRSVAAEIRRLRLEQAAELLRTTKLPVSAIADACGYGDAKQFRRALRADTGQTPGGYRRNPPECGALPSGMTARNAREVAANASVTGQQRRGVCR